MIGELLKNLPRRLGSPQFAASSGLLRSMGHKSYNRILLPRSFATTTVAPKFKLKTQFIAKSQMLPELRSFSSQSYRLQKTKLEDKKPEDEFKLSSHDAPPDSVWKEIKKLLQLSKPELPQMSVAFVCLCVSSAVSMLLPLVMGKVLDSSTKPIDEVEIYGLSLNQFYTVLAGVFVTGAIANMLRIVILRTVGERLVARLRTRILKNTLYQDSSFIDSNKIGDLISRISSDSSIVARSLTQNISDGLRSFLSGTVGLSMMFVVSWKLTGYMMIMLPAIGFIAFFYGRKVRVLSKTLQRHVGELTKSSEELLSATKTIQSFSNEKIAVRQFADEVRKVFQVGIKEARLSSVFFGSTGLIGNTMLLMILFIGTNMARSGELSLGDLTSFMMYAAYTGSSMFGLSGFYSELMKGVGAASRVFELNDRKPLISPTKGIKIKNDDLKGDIVFKDINFRYPTRPNHQIFNKLSFTINQGQHVCFVGPSGSGKSTITQLLLRFYDPLAGDIVVNGFNIRDLNLINYRRHLGIVQQEPLLFSGSIRENIRYGKLDSTDEEVEAAARKANCIFIHTFPDGFETAIGPRGTQLSGGQKQRIALARVLLANPNLLILDEATSALDSLSEKAINETLEERIRDQKTTISIAHRLSTIKNSNRVIVLNKTGEIVEDGEFDVLITKPNSELNKLLKNYRDEDPKQPKKQEADATTKEEIQEELEEELMEREREQLTNLQ